MGRLTQAPKTGLDEDFLIPYTTRKKLQKPPKGRLTANDAGATKALTGKRARITSGHVEAPGKLVRPLVVPLPLRSIYSCKKDLSRAISNRISGMQFPAIKHWQCEPRNPQSLSSVILKRQGPGRPRTLLIPDLK